MDSLRKIKIVQLNRGVFPRPPVFNISPKIVKVTHNKFESFRNQVCGLVAHQDENNDPTTHPAGEFRNNVNGDTYPLIFPFNPRAESNMPLIEKVMKWLQGIPFRLTESHDWVPDCFPTTITYNSAEDATSDAAYDLEDADAIEALQERKITRYTIRLYANDPEPVAYAVQTVCLFCTNF